MIKSSIRRSICSTTIRQVSILIRTTQRPSLIRRLLHRRSEIEQRAPSETSLYKWRACQVWTLLLQNNHSKVISSCVATSCHHRNLVQPLTENVHQERLERKWASILKAIKVPRVKEFKARVHDNQPTQSKRNASNYLISNPRTQGGSRARSTGPLSNMS